MGIARAHSQHEPHHVKVLFSALLLVVVCGSSPAAADAPSPYNLAEFSLATLKVRLLCTGSIFAFLFSKK